MQVVVDGMSWRPGRRTAAVATAGTPYKIAGKTGSAQVFTIAQNEKYHEKDLAERLLDHALSISFAPAEDPKLAVAVLSKTVSTAAARRRRLPADVRRLPAPGQTPVADKIPALGKSYDFR